MGNKWGFVHGVVDADPYLAQAHKNRISSTVAQIADELSDSGKSPKGNDASVASRLDRMESVMGQTGYRTLRSVSNAASPSSKIDVSWDAMGIGGNLVGAFSGTVDVTVVGLNGRDFSGGLSTQILYLWAVYNPTTQAAGLVLSASATAPTLTDSSFSGYTATRRIGETLQTGSSASLRPQSQQDTRIYLDTRAQVAGPLSATANTWTAQALNAQVGSTTCAALVQMVQNKDNNSSNATFVSMRRKGAASGATGIELFNRVHASGDARASAWVGVTSATAEIEWKATVAITNDGTLGIFVMLIAYEIPV